MRWLIFVVMLMALPAVNALDASLSLEFPASLNLGETQILKAIVSSNQTFNGSVILTLQGVSAQGSSTITVQSSLFTGSNPYTFTSLLPLTGEVAGPYIISGVLFDGVQNRSLINLQGTVQNTAPTITQVSPSGTLTDNLVTLSATTDRPATCKYDKNNVAYSSMQNSFAITGITNHEKTLTDVEEGDYTYYVKCRTTAGAVTANSGIISFSVNLPPSASIELSDPSPLKAGTITVTLTTNKDLAKQPTLTYIYADASGTNNQVFLTGSGSTWEGFFIIKENAGERIGQFSFSGQDDKGNIGTEITEGKVFIVDTVTPKAPGSIRSRARSDGSIYVTWNEQPEAELYKIYRSEKNSVDKLDFYAESVEPELIDANVKNKQTYYYKVSAIDEAGNEGALSNVIYATSIFGGSEEITSDSSQPTEEKIPTALTPELIEEVNDFLQEVQEYELDILQAKENLDAVREEEAKEVMGYLQLQTYAQQAENSLSQIKNKAEQLKEIYLEKPKLDERIGQLQIELDTAMEGVARDISLFEHTSFVQPVTKEDIQRGAGYLFSTGIISEEDQDKYVKKANKERDSITIQTQATSVNVEYLDGSSRDITLIRKDFTYEDPTPLADVFVVEIIPKTVAQSASEIQFGNINYEVIEDDPVLRYGFTTLDYSGKQVQYTIEKKVSIESAKGIQSVVIPNIIELEGSSVTGFSVGVPFGDFLSPTEFYMIIVSIVVLVGLSGYYYTQRKGQDPNSQDTILLAKTTGRIEEKMDESALYLTSLIHLCNHHYQQGAYDQAFDLYNRIQAHYRELPKEQKSQFYQQCTDLHTKLLGK